MSLLAATYLLYKRTCSRINSITSNQTLTQSTETNISRELSPLFTMEWGHSTLFAMPAKILIIDDNEAVAEYFSDLLTSHGFQTTVFNSSKNALDYCKKNLHQYSLVISDICMPEITGDQLAKEILKLNSAMPIVLCSGYFEHISINELLNLGIHSFIEKPVNGSELLTIIGELNLC